MNDARVCRVLNDGGVVFASASVAEFLEGGVVADKSGVATCVQIGEDWPMDLSCPTTITAGNTIQLWLPNAG